MKQLESIQHLYQPIQPSVKLDSSLISYQEFKPSNQLKHYIYCYWQLKTKETLSKPYKYRVVSDGCIDIFFEIPKPRNNFVMGFCRKFTEFEIGQCFDYIGIRFLPSFFPLLFNINAKNLSNQSQELSNILPEFSNWLSNIDQYKDIVKQCNSKLESILKVQDLNIDERFYTAINKILLKHGNIDVEAELSTGLGPRQLRRKFNYYLGTSAKAFANVVRFQHILKAKPSLQSLRDNKLYFDVGFFDQAHFIKSFKTFYGVTPSVAFN